MTSWKRVYFKEYLAYCYTLFASVMALMKFMISGHQAFKNDKSMLRRLYGETTAFVEKNKTEADQDSLGDSPRTAFKKSLEERREFKVNYYCFTLISSTLISMDKQLDTVMPGLCTA